MDALSRFWCELVRFKALAIEASEYDDGIYRPLRRDATESDRERCEWFNDKARHRTPPPGGLLSEWLYDEQFDGERLPRLEELARVANEERCDPDRLKAIKRALAAVVRLVDHLNDTDGRMLCDCDLCQRSQQDLASWDVIDRRLRRSFASLGFYVPAEALSGDHEELDTAESFTPPPCPVCQGQRIVTSTRPAFRYVKCPDCDKTVKVARGTANAL